MKRSVIKVWPEPKNYVLNSNKGEKMNPGVRWLLPIRGPAGRHYKVKLKRKELSV